MHSLVTNARGVATSIVVIALTTSRNILSLRRLCELPDIGERNSTRTGRKRALRKRASGRRRTSVIRHPVSNGSRTRVLPYVLGGDHAVATLLLRRNSGTINARPKARLVNSIHPRKQVCLLLRQQPTALFLIEKNDGLRSKTLTGRGLTARCASALPNSDARATLLSSRYKRPLNNTRNPNPAASNFPRFPAQVFALAPGGLFSQ